MTAHQPQRPFTVRHSAVDRMRPVAVEPGPAIHKQPDWIDDPKRLVVSVGESAKLDCDETSTKQKNRPKRVSKRKDPRAADEFEKRVRIPQDGR